MSSKWKKAFIHAWLKVLSVLTPPEIDDVSENVHKLIYLCMMPQTRKDGKALALYAAAAMMGYRLQTAWASWGKHTTVRRWKHDKKRLAAASCCERRIRRSFQAFVVRQQVSMMNSWT